MLRDRVDCYSARLHFDRREVVHQAIALLDQYARPAEPHGRNARAAAAGHRVEYELAGLARRLDHDLREPRRLLRGMDLALEDLRNVGPYVRAPEVLALGRIFFVVARITALHVEQRDVER